MKETVSYHGRELEILGSWETIIAGGGSAGASAALTSAAAGKKTLVVEKSIRLGGSSVNALVTPMMRSYTGHHSNFYALEKKLNAIAPVKDHGVSEQRWFSAEAMCHSWEELLRDAGCDLLYDATIADVLMDRDHIKGLVVAVTDGLCAVLGKQFVDASGDALVLRLAGVPCRRGDEDGNNQISSLRFEVGGVDIEKYRSYVFSLHDTYSVHHEAGDYFESAMVGGRGFALQPVFDQAVHDGVLIPDDLRYFQNYTVPGKPGVLSFNCPHLVHLMDNEHALDRSVAISEGRAAIRRLVRFLKGYMPGFENCYLVQEASMLGVRESWEMVGDYVMPAEDYTGRARFEDGVARGDWYIDVHSAKKSLVHQIAYQPGDYYEIPYRAMITSAVKNVCAAGRCISTQFLMEASIRIIPTVIDIGQAAGEACVMALDEGIDLHAVDGTKLREKLGKYC
ncbi:FAD-dependent oxidoreductase [Galactobacillus timonensis]|uniref:FAD-dependent oxidoreductase n=1 Tax=Galactobacillus timonensis TaxID=2041840 RepID=UPI000C82D94E|nr:FAD-dependent oxidoreductase [Galactobacillus timonensis]